MSCCPLFHAPLLPSLKSKRLPFTQPAHSLSPFYVPFHSLSPFTQPAIHSAHSLSQWSRHGLAENGAARSAFRGPFAPSALPARSLSKLGCLFYVPFKSISWSERSGARRCLPGRWHGHELSLARPLRARRGRNWLASNRAAQRCSLGRRDRRLGGMCRLETPRRAVLHESTDRPPHKLDATPSSVPWPPASPPSRAP